MNNVKSANFWQIDHKIKNIARLKGALILPSFEAWQKFIWTRKWFEKKPKEGYFIWVKEKLSLPLTTCITIAKPKVSQSLNNLLVIEKGVEARANVFCNAAESNLCVNHKARGKVIIKKAAALEYNHFHQWGKEDSVSPDYEFILDKDSRLIYNYKNFFPAKKLRIKTIIHNNKNSSVNLNFVIDGADSNIRLEDAIFLEGENSQGLVRLRLVGRKNSDIEAVSKVFAISAGKGHLDCQGILVDPKRTASRQLSGKTKNPVIALIPQLVCSHPLAQITHEASIGKISEEELNYLKMRGLTEKEAIDLIVSGFLKA